MPVNATMDELGAHYATLIMRINAMTMAEIAALNATYPPPVCMSCQGTGMTGWKTFGSNGEIEEVSCSVCALDPVDISELPF